MDEAVRLLLDNPGAGTAIVNMKPGDRQRLTDLLYHITSNYETAEPGYTTTTAQAPASDNSTAEGGTISAMRTPSPRTRPSLHDAKDAMINECSDSPGRETASQNGCGAHDDGEKAQVDDG